MSSLVRHASLVAAPWKNGGGSTTEIAISPRGAGYADFDWRLSLATISADGPFSSFPGVDRTLALVDGPGAILDIDGATRFVLGADQPLFEFKGEAAIQASLTGGSTTDLNVMTRRARCHHRLARHRLAGRSELAPRGDVNLLFLAEGDRLGVRSDGERMELARYDALACEGDTRWTFEAGEVTVLVAEIFFD